MDSVGTREAIGRAGIAKATLIMGGCIYLESHNMFASKFDGQTTALFTLLPAYILVRFVSLNEKSPGFGLFSRTLNR